MMTYEEMRTELVAAQARTLVPIGGNTPSWPETLLAVLEALIDKVEEIDRTARRA